MNDNYDDLYKSTHLCYKVILAGDAFVGKTNLVYKFIKNGNENTKNIAPTVGVEFSSKMVRLNDGKRIKAQIWDTGSSTITQLDRNNIDP
jgi:GTPase SAR1 family protein